MTIDDNDLARRANDELPRELARLRETIDELIIAVRSLAPNKPPMPRWSGPDKSQHRAVD